MVSLVALSQKDTLGLTKGEEMTLAYEMDASERPSYKHLFATKIIQNIVANEYGLKRADLLSERRTFDLMQPRWVSMYLCKVVLGKSTPVIGFRHGGKSQASVLYSIEKIELALKEDTSFAERVEKLRLACVEQLSS